MEDLNKRNIIDLDVEQLQANPLQPRGIITSDSVQDLVESIKEHGILEPLVVAHTPAGYQIIVGERRWRASKIAGLTKVPCIVKETSPQQMLEMAIVENVQREDLNPIDRAKALERLMEEFNLTNTEIAKRIGKSASYISNSLRLLQLPDAIKDGLLSGLISEGHARAIQGIQDDRLMIEAYKMILKESASVRKAEEIARRMKFAIGQPIAPVSERRKVNEQKQYIVSEKLDKLEDEIRETLGEKAKVRLKRTIKQTIVNITFLGNLEETEKKLIELHQAIVGIKPNLEGGQ